MLIVRMNKRSGCEVIDNNFKNGMDCCPFIGRCSAYAKEMRKQSPFNAHPIDFIPDGCRIIEEIPDKHGRLIDADLAIKNLDKYYCKECDNWNGVRCKTCDHYWAMQVLEDAPTVLEGTKWQYGLFYPLEDNND